MPSFVLFCCLLHPSFLPCPIHMSQLPLAVASPSPSTPSTPYPIPQGTIPTPGPKKPGRKKKADNPTEGAPAPKKPRKKAAEKSGATTSEPKLPKKATTKRKTDETDISGELGPRRSQAEITKLEAEFDREEAEAKQDASNVDQTGLDNGPEDLAWLPKETCVFPTLIAFLKIPNSSFSENLDLGG